MRVAWHRGSVTTGFRMTAAATPAPAKNVMPFALRHHEWLDSLTNSVLSTRLAATSPSSPLLAPSLLQDDEYQGAALMRANRWVFMGC